MKKLQSEAFYKVAKTMIIIGYALCLGGIASSIAMNNLAGDNPSVEFWHWQRFFISSIIDFVIKPGVVVFFIGNTALYCLSNNKRKTSNVISLLLPILMLVNMLVNLNPYVKIVDALTERQFQSGSIMEEFINQKSIEDTFGALNLLLLVAYLVLYIIKIRKPQFDGQCAQENQII